MADHLDEDLLVRHLASELSAVESQALEEHLDSCSRCRRVAAELVRSDDVETEDDPVVGRSFDGWQVKRLLGAGAFSEVYLAHHASIDRPGALKVLKRAQAPEQARRLLDEARAVNKIRHAGIVDVFGAGTTQGGRPYLLMELLDGETLEALLARREKLPADEAMVLLEGILEPLDAAHRAGVLHRDLKPGNVMISRKQGGRPSVKLLDFGLAKQGVAIDGLAASTRGRIVGTPAYMAPEQCRDGGAVGAPTDLYAVGIIAYELLTGQVPFDGPAVVTVMKQHAFELPAQLPRDVPPALAGWVMHLLVKEPGSRPASAQVALAALRRIRLSSEDFAASAPTENAAAPVLVPAPTEPELEPVRPGTTRRMPPVKPRR